MNIIQDIDAFGAALKAWAIKEEEAIVAKAEQLVPQLVNDFEIGVEKLAQFAGMAVLKATYDAVTGQERFGAAVGHLISAVETESKTIAINTARMAVQQAFLVAGSTAAAGTSK